MARLTTSYEQCEKAGVGQKILKQAREEQITRSKRANTEAHQAAMDGAKFIVNRGKGMVQVIGGFGEGFRLGAGKWRYIKGEWVQL